MHHAHDEEVLEECFQDVTGCAPTHIQPIVRNLGGVRSAGAPRRYRLQAEGTTLIGVINPQAPENEALVYFARLFSSLGLPVPSVLSYRPDLCAYIEEDLGESTLADLLHEERAKAGDQSSEIPRNAFRVYRLALEFLPLFQVRAAERIDFAHCYPVRELLTLTVKNDRMAFTHEFAQWLLPSCDVSAIFQDFQALNIFLAQAPAHYFVHRAFSARTILVRGFRPYFTEFHGGCRGALQYDLVSLLCETATSIPDSDHIELVEHYLETLRHYATVDRDDFLRLYSSFVVSRMLHLLGLFGEQHRAPGTPFDLAAVMRILALLLRELQSPYAPITLPAIAGYIPHFQEALALWQSKTGNEGTGIPLKTPRPW